jgi:hypothetical protein
METPYITEVVAFKAEVLNAAEYVPGTYKKGQLVGRLNATGKFCPYNSAVSTGAEVIAAVCPADMVIEATARTAGPAARGEFSREGVAAVMASLATPVALDAKLIGQCWDAGIILN